jgi:hypothetical protein
MKPSCRHTTVATRTSNDAEEHTPVQMLALSSSTRPLLGPGLVRRIPSGGVNGQCEPAGQTEASTAFGGQYVPDGHGAGVPVNSGQSQPAGQARGVLLLAGQK